MANKDKYRTYVLPNLEKIEKWIAEGVGLNEISKALGISLATFYEHANKHSELQEAVTRGRQNDAAALESVLHQRAMGFTGPDGRYYPPDVKSLSMLLASRDPERWGKVNQMTANVSLTAEDKALLERVDKRQEDKPNK